MFSEIDCALSQMHVLSAHVMFSWLKWPCTKSLGARLHMIAGFQGDFLHKAGLLGLSSPDALSEVVMLSVKLQFFNPLPSLLLYLYNKIQPKTLLID